MDARQDGPYGWIADGICLEVFDADRAVGQRPGQAVLQAELRLEPALRIGSVGVLESSRVRSLGCCVCADIGHAAALLCVTIDATDLWLTLSPDTNARFAASVSGNVQSWAFG